MMIPDTLIIGTIAGLIVGIVGTLFAQYFRKIKAIADEHGEKTKKK